MPVSPNDSVFFVPADQCDDAAEQIWLVDLPNTEAEDLQKSLKRLSEQSSTRGVSSTEVKCDEQTAPTHNNSQRRGASENRFVAGNRFFNYELYGSLRPGGPVKLWSRKLIGISVAVFANTLLYRLTKDTGGALLTKHLDLSIPQTRAVLQLMEFPAVLTVFIGILSDCRAIDGYQRKSLLFLGFLIKALAGFCILVFSQYEQYLATTLGMTRVWLWMCSLAPLCCGLMITYTITLTQFIELTQQEDLKSRGSTLAAYVILRLAGAAVAGVIGTALEQEGDNMTLKNIQCWLSILLAISIAMLPVVVLALEEVITKKLWVRSIKRHLRLCIKLLQQRALWHTLGFITIVLLFLEMEVFTVCHFAIMSWSYSIGPSLLTDLLDEVLCFVVGVSTVVHWKRKHLNSPWHHVFAIAPVCIALPSFISGVLTTFNVVRHPALIYLTKLLGTVSVMILEIMFVVPVAEITTRGSEGTTAGLITSVNQMIRVIVSSISNSLDKLDLISIEDIGSDSRDVRWRVFATLVIQLSLHLISLAGLYLLPRQKLDAQLLRIYGGFTPTAGTGILAAWIFFFVYTIVMSIMPFMRSSEVPWQ